MEKINNKEVVDTFINDVVEILKTSKGKTYSAYKVARH